MSPEAINEIITHYENVIKENLDNLKYFAYYDMTDAARLECHVLINHSSEQIEIYKNRLENITRNVKP